MENGLKTIKDLFDGTKIFRIPIYQRAYSWSDKQLKDFIEDIKNQKTDRTYFLGTILLEKGENEGDFRGINIVDGQQRMTTLVIFMKVLLELLKNNNQDIEILEETYIKYKNRFKLKLQEEDSEFFETYILGDIKNPQLVINRPSQQKLLAAKNYFESCLASLDLKKLVEIKDKINKTKLLTYSVEDNAEATLIFETTNDRGKSLTNLEKIKSFLMYKCYLASDESSDMLKRIYKRFSDVYDLIESIKIDDEDSVLQYHFIAYENWGSKKDYQDYLLMIKNHINQLLLDGKDEEVISYIENYTTKLREAFCTIGQIQKENMRSLKEIYLQERLGITFYPLLIKSYQLDTTEDKKEFEDIAKLLEIFSFRVIGMKAKRTSDIDSAINLLVRSFRGNFRLLKFQLVEKILEYCNDSRFREKLSSADFFNDFPGERVYLFWKYENYLRSLNGYSPMSFEEYSSDDSRFELTIEHIAPQNPKENENRIITTADCSFTDYTSEEFKESYLHCIGNLTFDPRSANSSKGRKPIEEKNSKYFKRAPFMTQNELEDFLDSSAWSVNSITKRKEKIISLALDTWDPIKVVGSEQFNEYIEENENSADNSEAIVPEYTEEFARTKMGGSAYMLLQDMRRQLKEITSFKEKINKYFIGFRNSKHYFATVNWRQDYIFLNILDFDQKHIIKDPKVEFFTKYKELNIKMFSSEDIGKYLGLVKFSKRYSVNNDLELEDTPEEENEKQKLRLEFWKQLLDKAKIKTKLHANINPGKYHWIGGGSGKTGLSYNYLILNSYVGCELYLDKGKRFAEPNINKIRFDELIKHQSEIEKLFGDKLLWERLDDKRACRISFTLDYGIYDREKWSEMQDKMIDVMIRLENSTKEYVQKLN